MADNDTPIKHSSYPYLFDSTEISFPRSWKENFKRVVQSKQSEAGGDIETVVRRGKLTVSAQCNGTSDMVKTIESFYNVDSFVLSRYDSVAEDYTTHTVRMTAFSADRIYKTESIETTVGLWKISFTLEEF